MDGSPTGFWGKLAQDDQGIVSAWHPLVAHCADVAACCEALLERTLLRRRLAAMAGLDDLDAVQCARLCVLAALHDIGKFNVRFQRKALPTGSGPTAGHVVEVLLLFEAFSDTAAGRALLGALPLTEWESWGDSCLELLVAAICHHGRPHSTGDASGRADSAGTCWLQERGLEPMVGIRALVDATRAWFPKAWERSGTTLPGTPEFQHGFSGLVMLADWLGSDRAQFPFADSLDDRMAFARRAAAEALTAMSLDPTRAQQALARTPFDFATVFSNAPRPAQAAILRVPVDRDRALVVLEAETGSGKTEAALSYFFRLYTEGRVDGMYFALPTRTAATQLHRRVREAVAGAISDGAPPVVLAVPGYLRVDDAEGKRLAPFEVLWNDPIPGSDREHLRHRTWAAESPKRFLASAIAVGTIDQVLLSVLQVSHAHLRSTALSRQLLVVDEVHASDAYMGALLTEVLRRHLSAGGHALLMSATLGQSLRSALLASVNDRPSYALPSLAESVVAAYPAVHRATIDSNEPFNVEGDATQKLVRFETAPIAADPAEITRRALDAARDGARVLVLRNTVSDCIATQRSLELHAARTNDSALLFQCRGVPAPHHARFASDDRRALDEAIEEHFGKRSHRNGVVAVATQTVQQSLDLDADLLLTDLCPIDVLLQRIGRLHRHGDARRRPRGYETASLTVLVPEERALDGLVRADGSARGPHGMGSVYEDLRVLEATWRQLEPAGSWQIPLQNRELVERATHPEALAAVVSSLGDAWKRHEGRVIGTQLAAKGIAGLNVFNRCDPFGKASFRDLSNDERISTRLGQSDRRAVFERAFTSAFGNSIRELSVPAWMAHDLPRGDSPSPGWDAEPGGAVSITWGGGVFRYDRLGLQRERVDEGVEG